MSVTRHIERMEAKIGFLREHQALLDSLDYDTVAEANPDTAYKLLTWVSINPNWSIEVELSVYGPDPKPVVKQLRRAIGGHFDKKATDYSFKLVQQRQDNHLRVIISVQSRDAVCTKKLVRIEKVEVPAVEAQPARVEEEEIFEYECGSVLSD